MSGEATMRLRAIGLLAAGLLPAMAAGCGGEPTGPVYGAPQLVTVNGVTNATGMIGMTVILEGTDLAEARFGAVYFMGTDGNPVQATSSDWSNTYIIATVPQGTAAESQVWVETTWGKTDSLSFVLISTSTFSPSIINWTRTLDLPQPLQALGAVFVPVIYGAQQAQYIFTVGGAAHQTHAPVTAVYRGSVEGSGAISEWAAATSLPDARAQHAVAAATPFTARVDTTTAAYVYAIGGVDSSGATTSSIVRARVRLDGAMESWQTTRALPAPRHAAAAMVYRGFLYVLGGADADGVPSAAAWRAAVAADGSLNAWQSVPELPAAVAKHGLVNFGPFLYVVGGETAAVDPTRSTPTGSETSASYTARIDMRDGSVPSWTNTSQPGKARSKHGIMSAGGAVMVTSGMYAGQDGSSENSYASINPDGTLSSWAGATGSNTILSVLGHSLFNAAAISFVDANGHGHVVVLGGGVRGTTTGAASPAVLYY
jgi:hypothetical protein